MATKSYSKHKEYKEFSSSRSAVPYNSDEAFDMIKSDLLPANSKLRSLPGGDGEYHYEYHEDRHPSGKYERKDLHTVEKYTVPPNNVEDNSYSYKYEEKSVPAITSSSHYEHKSSSSTPGYSRIKSSKKDVSHNVEELDSLLDDLQRDQERQLYKSGYTSDTAESSSFDYRKTSTPIKSPPSSGYSTLKTEQRVENWRSSPLPAPKIHSEFKKEVFREEKHGSTVKNIPTTVGYSTKTQHREDNWTVSPVAAPKVHSEIKKEMFREEKHESRVVPAQVSPAIPQTVPAPVCHQCLHPSSTLSRSDVPMNKVTTTVKTYTYEVPADTDPTTLPVSEISRYAQVDSSNTHTHTTTAVPPSPSLGCQYCTHCNTRITRTQTGPAAPVTSTMLREHRVETAHDSTTTTTEGFPRNDRILYPKPANEVRSPANLTDVPDGPNTYKWSETSYSAYNSSERHPANGASPSPFPRPHTPAANEQPPKKLDELLAEFPDARFPAQPDGVTQRKVEVHNETTAAAKQATKPVSGPAVYYPPGHTPFQKKEASYEYGKQSAGGGQWAAGRGMYEYESGSKSKEKSSESKKVLPVCLPICCAMPCSIM